MNEQLSNPSSETKNVKSIVKAAAIIEVLSASEDSLALSDIVKELNIAKSTLHGLISTLVDVGYITQDSDTGQYRLGIKLFEIGNTVPRRWDERTIAYPYMQKLAEQTGETIHLAVLDNFEVLYINKLESSKSIRIVTGLGVRMPAHCTGVGKVLLSGLNPYELNKFYRRRKLEKYTDTTVTDFEELKIQLEKIKAAGFAVDNQEYMEGLKCVAAPIYDHKGNITSTMSIAGPLSRMRDNDFEVKKNYLMAACKQISEKLGYEG